MKRRQRFGLVFEEHVPETSTHDAMSPAGTCRLRGPIRNTGRG
jgi:hypothetical protein